MDTRTRVQDWTATPRESLAKKMPASGGLASFKILVIARDHILRMYTDEVLRSAGFPVLSVPPWEARNVLNDGSQVYPLVVFSHTLWPEDISELGLLVRRVHPGTRVLLLRGPEPVRPDPALYDVVLDGLDGPAALIEEVHRLLGYPSASHGSAALSA